MLSELIGSFEYTVNFIEKQVADLSDEDIVSQPPGAPNHAAWTLGHIIFSCQEIAGELGVERWLPSDWESRFGYGSVPAAEASPRSSKSALLGSLREASKRLRDAMRRLDEKALASPLPDADADTWFPVPSRFATRYLDRTTWPHHPGLPCARRLRSTPPGEPSPTTVGRSGAPT